MREEKWQKNWENYWAYARKKELLKEKIIQFMKRQPHGKIVPVKEIHKALTEEMIRAVLQQYYESV